MSYSHSHHKKTPATISPGLAILALTVLGVLGATAARSAETPVTSTLIAGGGTLSPDTVSGVAATDVLLGVNLALYVDGAGTVYVPNGQGNEGRLNIVDSLGDMYRFAGTGVSGALPADGTPAIDANLPSPIDVIEDDAGNIYVSVWTPSSTDGKIYRIDPSGNIFLIAGGGTAAAGTENVPAVSVRLFQVYAMQYRDGFLYFAEFNLGRIARIDLSTGIVTTYGGGLSNRNAVPIPDPMNPPDAVGFQIGDAQEIVFDSAGSLYFRTRNNGTPDAIRKITPDGKLHDVVTNNGTVTPDAGVAAADLDYAWSANGLAIDTFDNLYFQMSGGRLVILNLNTGIVSHVLRVDNFVSVQDIEIGPDGDIYLAQNREVRRIGAIFPVITNTDPVADCVIDQLTDIGNSAEVSFSGAGSSDAEDPNADLDFEWRIDDGATVTTAAGETIVRTLGYGEYEATLTVTDTDGATDTCTENVTISPADLAVLDCEKISVKFCLGDADSDPGDDDSSADDDSGACLSDRVSIKGEIGLPMGVNYTDLTTAQALVLVDAAGVEFTDGTINTFDVNGSDNEHWKYRAGGPGLKRLDIDWKGARFKYIESGVPVEFESELIASSETVLEMKYRVDEAGGPFTVDFDGAQLLVDAAGVVTAGTGLTGAAIEVKKTGKKVTVTLPFAITEGSSISFGGSLSALPAIAAADHYTNSLGRFRLEAESGSTLPLGATTLPRETGMIIGVGGPLYTNSCSAGPDDLKVHSRKWKAKKQ